MASLPPVLIVDDDPDDVFILKRLLLKAGVQNKVIAFEDPTAAVAYLEAESAHSDSRYIPWIIFTDLNMPRLDGVQLTRWIRSKATLKDVVVLMVSSSENPADKEAAEASGANRYLVKYPSVGSLELLAAEFRPTMKIFSDCD